MLPQHRTSLDLKVSSRGLQESQFFSLHIPELQSYPHYSWIYGYNIYIYTVYFHMLSIGAKMLVKSFFLS